ncbi:MAG: P-loop NTPase fold protein [Herbaspirillum sp.]
MIFLSADRPSTDPKEDLFGYAPFAENLADSICRYQDSDGLVLAIYGPWGSGKSTVLGYVNHYLEQQPDESRPVVVAFNPWWFSGQENLARAFLGQLQVVLPTKSEKFKKLARLLGDLAEAVGGQAGTLVAKLIRIWCKPKDVPALKAEISKILREAKKRVLVIIDDIDRLTPEETRQLFTVIKALADFPNVVYLLAFDREVAAQAIEQQSGLPGERYLEKIIQVPFELPPVDRVALQNALSERLRQVLGDMGGLFDQHYWANVFHDGIDPLIQVPRDVVRFTNTLSVTYPAVRDEVNPVDFIALEAIRVFLPDLYAVVRTNQDRFAGHSNDSGRHEDPSAKAAFHRQWAAELPERCRESTQALLKRIFPKIGQMIHSDDWLSQWRRKLRACHPEIFPVYFHLAVPQGAISRSEMMALLAPANSAADFGAALVHAKDEQRPDGLSKACVLLECLVDHVEDIVDEHIPTVIQALFDVGDLLNGPARGIFNFGNTSRASRLVYYLLKRVPANQRADILDEAIKAGNALAVQSLCLQALDEEITSAENSGEPTQLTAGEVTSLKATWISRVRTLSKEADFLDRPELLRLLSSWRHWGDVAEARAWCDRVTASDDGLLALLPKLVQYSTFHTMGDRAARLQPRLNPNSLESYLDTASCAKRLAELVEKREVPDEARQVVTQFLKEFEMLKAGKNPDDAGVFDE